jgi:hypothetical protein
MKVLTKIASLTAALLFSAEVMAHPIAAIGTEGFKVIASGGEVIATYEGNSAGYSNDLFLGLDFIFNNHVTPVGTSTSLGIFAAGTELIFRLHVNNTGEDWYTGPASRNADGKTHARVQENWATNTTLVSFEDLINTPEGDWGYNDLSFSFTNTKAGTSVPESSPFILMMLGLGLLTFARRQKI